MSPLTPRARQVGGVCALLLLTLAAYAPVAGNGWIWDDDYHVTNNPTLRDLEGLGRIWLDTAATPQYYPATHTSFWIEYHLWGTEPAGYHLTNVLLHALASVLLWRLLIPLIGPGAWLAAAVFALHPVHVESVAWVSERKNVLSGAFCLGAAWLYLKGSSRLGAVALLLYVAALLSKTVTATLPITLALIVVWKHGRLPRRDAILLSLMLLLGAAMGSLTLWIERHQIGTQGMEWSLSVLQSLLLASRAGLFYLGKLVWPVGLVFIYPRWEIDPTSWVAWIPLVSVVTVVVALATGIRRGWGTPPLIALGCFGITLSPAAGFFDVYPFRYSYVADHFQYLASIGPITLASACLARAAGAFARRGPWSAWLLRRAAGVVLLVVLAGLTFRQTLHYRDEETLWRSVLERNPDAWIAHNNLGVLLSRRGNLRGAIDHFQKAVALKPDHASALDNLGLALAGEGRVEDAIDAFRRSIEVGSGDPDTHANLGDALRRAGKADAAVAAYEEALRRAPGHLQALIGLGNALLDRGDPVAAEVRFAEALRQRPEDPALHFNHAVALGLAGREAEAAEAYGRVLARAPFDAEAHANLGILLGRGGNQVEALRHFQEAVRLDPGNETYRRNLEVARALARVRQGPPP